MDEVKVIEIKKSIFADNEKDADALLRHLPALEKMLWGGTLMLIVDHVINGELTWRVSFSFSRRVRLPYRQL